MPGTFTSPHKTRFYVPFFLLSLLPQLACDGNDKPSPASGGGHTATAGTGVGGRGGTAGAAAAGASGDSPGGFIVVDQFGYRPNSKKVAVIRDPETGYDAAASFTPGSTYVVVDEESGERVLEGSPTAWKNGAVDPSSGDRAHWFDFSAVTEPGTYYVLDVERDVRSPAFEISPDVYREVLRHAFRTFFYQRAGQVKSAEHAGAGWADGASHLGEGQDTEARLFSAPNDASTERDLRGGWYDAGDLNKYTNWHAGYVVQMFRTFREKPQIWGDDAGIPESGNGTPDIIDEALFGLDYLERLQNQDGSVLSIVGLASASPPSAATGPSRYGPPSTSATLSAAAAFAYSATTLEALGGDFAERVPELREAAERAYAWAEENPAVVFRNNDSASGSSGLGAGQQEVDDAGRRMKQVEAACYLFELTGKEEYKAFFDGNYRSAGLFAPYAYAWNEAQQEMLLHYTTLEGATPAVAEAIRTTYATALRATENLRAHRDGTDPYLAPITPYTWGSNSVKALQGSVFHALVRYEFDDFESEEVLAAAESYVHYLHGVNPLGLTYLSNMGDFGAERSVNEFFHTWFADGSAKWDRVGMSTYGPPPGFLTGGPNASYEWDGCCPSSCGGGARCGTAPPTPPSMQPPQKSYLDFNTSWPLNSWSVTENSNGYQIAYLRLLSKFVD